MLLRIDPTSTVAIYTQIAAAVRRQVADGDLSVGDRLPPARDLAEALGVNLHTVLRGYQELRDEGLVELRRGRGAVIAGSGSAVRAGAAARAALAQYVQEARRAGLTPGEAAELVREQMT